MLQAATKLDPVFASHRFEFLGQVVAVQGTQPTCTKLVRLVQKPGMKVSVFGYRAFGFAYCSALWHSPSLADGRNGLNVPLGAGSDDCHFVVKSAQGDPR